MRFGEGAFATLQAQADGGGSGRSSLREYQISFLGIAGILTSPDPDPGPLAAQPGSGSAHVAGDSEEVLQLNSRRTCTESALPACSIGRKWRSCHCCVRIASLTTGVTQGG